MTVNHRWDYRPGQNVSLIAGDLMMARYAFDPDEAPKPFFHPLLTPNGVPLTAYQPSDHVWHRGLWFSWKYINDVNYWEERNRAEDDGLVRLESDGRTLPAGPESLTFQDGAARIVHPLRYVDPEGVEVLTELRAVTIRPPGRDSNLRIDFAHVFTAGANGLCFGATPVNEQTPWGGYSGLGIRASRSLIGFEVLTDEGITGGQANGARARWVDLTGVADGAPGLKAGLTLFDHPLNPRHPSPAYVYYDSAAFGYINPSLVRDEPFELAPGATLRLAYRALAHDGPANPAALDEEARDFAASTPFYQFDSHA